MSLLLDALYKASKDKEKAAELSLVPFAPEVPTPVMPAQTTAAPELMLQVQSQPQPEVALELAVAEPVQSRVLSAALDVPFPSLELELEPHPSDSIEKTPIPPPVPVPPVEVPPAPKLEAPVIRVPQPEPAPLQRIELDHLAPAAAPVPAALPEVAIPSTSAPEVATLAAATTAETGQTVPPVHKPAGIRQPSKIAQILSGVQSRSTKDKSKPHRRTQVLGGVAVVLAVGGLYLYQSLDAAGLPVPMAHNPAAAPPPTEMQAEMPSAIAMVSSPAVQNVAVSAVALTAVEKSTAEQPGIATQAGAMQDRQVQPKAPARAPLAKASAATAPAAGAPREETFLRPSEPQAFLTAKAAKPQALDIGYAALLDGRLEDASQAYAKVLKTNSQERDALLGMAYIAHQRGQRELALEYYQRVLRQDPANAVATAAVLTLDAALDPAAAAVRARDLVARQPDSVAAITSAANALIREGLLAEAVPLFARAQRLEPGNALHAYNHAVALDRLGQVDPAIEQYLRVLKIADQQLPSGVRPFSLEAVRLRLQELKPSPPATSESIP